MFIQSNLHYVRNAFFIFVFLNLIFLNIKLLTQNDRSNALTTNSLKTELKESCDVDCVDNIYTAIKIATSSQQPKNISQTVVASELIKEQYFSIGAGSSNSDDWVDVPGLQVYIDITKYPNIQEVRFEASVNIPTGNQKAYVRLFNVTDKHPVWYSDVSLEGGETKLLISQPIQLDSGNKLYGVQMKTSLKYTANLLQSRIHMILK